MARASQKKTKTTVKVKSSPPTDGRVKCNMCGGTGYHKAPARKKK